MATSIFVNLPVKDLKTSMDFFAALASGGGEPKPPQDHGFMKSRTFTDPDGHHWEVVWMNPEGMPQ